MKKVTGSIIGIHFMRNNSVVLDTTDGLIHFPHLMRVKTASNQNKFKTPLILTENALTIPPRTTETLTAFVDHSSEENTAYPMMSMDKFTETASLLISHSMSTINDKRVAVRVTNTTESVFPIRKNTQIAEFSEVTPEQSKYIKPVDMAILSMIPPDDLDLTTDLN